MYVCLVVVLWRENHVIIMILNPQVSRVNTADHMHETFCFWKLSMNARAQSHGVLF